MSRVIKFRAWFDSHGFMGNVITLKGSNRTNYDADMWDEVTAECYVDGKQQFFSSYNFKLLQFTGLLDKNGEEIYDGDLLQWFDTDGINFTAFEVFFHDGNQNSDYNIGWSINRIHLHGNVAGSMIPPFKPKTTSQMIIIGNIYEHKHLLK